MRKHRLGKQLLIVLCVSLIVFLAGCRPSPVLEQIIYEQQHEVDPDTETKTMNDDLENEEPDEDIPSRETVDDSQQEKDQEYTSALAGDTDTDSEDPDAVYSVTYSPSGELSEPDATNPTEGSTSETATSSTGSGGNEGGATSSGAGDASGNDGLSADGAGGTTAGDGSDGGGNGEGEGDLVSGDGPEETNDEVPPEVVDDDSKDHEELPTGTRVTAVGEAATIVEMMGDSAQLVGTSSDYYGNNWAFDLSETNVWWDGDGSSACSNFQALLDVHPDVCFEISGQGAFSDEQITALEAAGIAYVPLPPLNSIENIKNAVTDVGQVIGGDAEGIASNYCNWADNTINQATGNYSTKATAYIGWWDYDAYWRVSNTARVLGEGYGVPVSMAYNGISPLTECMGYAGLINTSSDNYYVEPVNRFTYEPTIIGEARFPVNYTKHIIYSETLGIGLGTVDYPAIIVENNEIRDNILSAENGNYFRCHWLEGRFMYFGNTIGYGADDGYGGFIGTDIQNDILYRILVNPSGVGNWVKGSVESPLEAVWLACEFQGLNVDLGSMVSDFYDTFYHTGADLSAIIPDDWTYDYDQ